MTETRPTKTPEWASANPTDPVSGQPAIIEPSEAKKDSGHLRLERPTRHDHNWLFNLIWKWIEWLDQETVHSRFGPHGFIAGMCMRSNDNEIIQIRKGATRLGYHDVAVPWTKKLIETNAWKDWSEGNAGGLVPDDLSVIGMKWMHIFMIADEYLTKYDFAADFNTSASNILGNATIAGAGYVWAKRIGSVAVRDEGKAGTYRVCEFQSYGDEFVWVYNQSNFPATGYYWGLVSSIGTSPGFYPFKLGNVSTGTEFADMDAVPVTGCVGKFSMKNSGGTDVWLWSKTDYNYAQNFQISMNLTENHHHNYELVIVEGDFGARAAAGTPSLLWQNQGYRDFRRDLEIHV